jgi:membrane-associated phospholipid phosphatase
VERILISPTATDRSIARTAARLTTPAIQKTARVMTWLGDDHVLLGLAAALWLASRRASFRRRAQADHLLASLATASLLPKLIKTVVDQQRPDRCMVGQERRGIETSGNAEDAFPSGHAVHMSASASALGWMYPDKRRLFWGAAAVIGATRVAILAHWASDVALGFALGLGAERALRPLAVRRIERANRDE